MQGSGFACTAGVVTEPIIDWKMDNNVQTLYKMNTIKKGVYRYFTAIKQ